MSEITLESIKEMDTSLSTWEMVNGFYPNWEGTPLEFLDLSMIPIADKQWLLLRKEYLSEDQLRAYDCFCAESFKQLFDQNYTGDDGLRFNDSERLKWVNKQLADFNLREEARGMERKQLEELRRLFKR